MNEGFYVRIYKDNEGEVMIGTDQLYEVKRDAALEIERLNRRCNALKFGSMCMVLGALATGFLLGKLL